MPTSLTPSLAETSGVTKQVPPGTLAYFRQRLRNRLHQIVLREFVKREKARTLNRSDLAFRIDRKKEQLTRWLGAPGNWTLDTVSDLLIGMGLELVVDTADTASLRRPKVMQPLLDLSTPAPPVAIASLGIGHTDVASQTFDASALNAGDRCPDRQPPRPSREAQLREVFDQRSVRRRKEAA